MTDPRADTIRQALKEINIPAAIKRDALAALDGLLADAAKLHADLKESEDFHAEKHEADRARVAALNGLMASAAEGYEARVAALETALRDLHSEVEMAEAVGVCLPDRTATLRAGALLAAPARKETT